VDTLKIAHVLAEDDGFLEGPALVRLETRNDASLATRVWLTDAGQAWRDGQRDLDDLGWDMPAAKAFAQGYQAGAVMRFDGGSFFEDVDTLIEEVPVSLEFNGKAAIVMMATPTDLEDFALGFALTEGIVDVPGQVLALDIVPTRCGVGALITLEEGLWERADARKRDRAAGSSCSLCGIGDMREALRVPKVTPSPIAFTPSAIQRAFEALPSLQRIGAQTGAAHAAAFADRDGRILAVAEDAGRHNALDKLVGRLARLGLDPSTGFCALTSRASFEMVQKAAMAGFPMLCAISAPTGLAQRIAEQAGLTLCAFVRGNRFVCFAHPQRIAHPAAGA
jgi:FdhD protein